MPHTLVIGRHPRHDERFIDANRTPEQLLAKLKEALAFPEATRFCTFAPHALDLWRALLREHHGFAGYHATPTEDAPCVYGTMFVHAGREAGDMLTDVPVTAFGTTPWLDERELASLYHLGNLGTRL